MKKIIVDNKTKFWILYQELYGESEKVDTFDKQIEQLVDNLPIKSCNTSIVDKKQYGYNRYLKFSTINNYEIFLGNAIRVFCKTPINNYEIRVTEKVIINNLIQLIKNVDVIPKDGNRKAINAFLRGKKSWNYLILKSVKE